MLDERLEDFFVYMWITTITCTLGFYFVYIDSRIYMYMWIWKIMCTDRILF